MYNAAIMEREVRYCQTKDGVSIAFTTYGRGSPLVWANPFVVSHVQREWDIPVLRAAYSAYARFAMLVRFDARGVGLSDRDVADLSIEARARDLEAVVDHLQLERIDLIGVETGGPPAMLYAARFPKRVSHLLLVNCYARGASAWTSQRGRAMLSLIDDWEMMRQNVGPQAFGFGWEGAKAYAELVGHSITPETYARLVEADRRSDLTPILPEIQSPTLVVHNGLKAIPMDASRELASRIPRAQLYVTEGLYLDKGNDIFMKCAEFLGFGAPSAVVAPATRVNERHAIDRVQTIIFTDLVGHTEMMQRLGDERGREVLREHETITRNVLKQYGGTEVKTLGDGFMASFGSVTKAVECAVALQRAFAGRNQLAPEPLKVRVGLNAGEPIEEDGDLFGATVILASRIAAKAEGGEILASDVVRGLCSGKGFLFADRGEFVAKGFGHPVRVFDVSWRS